MADANTDENFALGTSDCRAESLEREFGEQKEQHRCSMILLLIYIFLQEILEDRIDVIFEETEQ